MPLPKKLTLTAKSRTVTAAKAKVVMRARSVSQTRGPVRTTIFVNVDSNSRELAIEAISAAAWMLYGPSNVPLSPAVIKARVTGTLDAFTKLIDHCTCVIKKRWCGRL